jgi:hypothetical protein
MLILHGFLVIKSGEFSAAVYEHAHYKPFMLLRIRISDFELFKCDSSIWNVEVYSFGQLHNLLAVCFWQLKNASNDK